MFTLMLSRVPRWGNCRDDDVWHTSQCSYNPDALSCSARFNVLPMHSKSNTWNVITHPDGGFPPFLPSTSSQKPPPQQSSPDYYTGSHFSSISLSKNATPTALCSRLRLTTLEEGSLAYTWSKVTQHCAFIQGWLTYLSCASMCSWCLHIGLREGIVAVKIG